MRTHTPGYKQPSDTQISPIKNARKSIISSVNIAINKLKTYPGIAHLFRASERFNDRLGSEFGAAITYFSFLSIIPIFMISFSAAGFVLASHPELFNNLTDKIIHIIDEPTLAETLEKTVTTAVQQRTTVGIAGLLLALYSGINWMGYLRDAVRAQTRTTWERKEKERVGLFKRYVKDFISLIGLMLAMTLTIALTSIAGAAQSTIIGFLGLADTDWLKIPLTVITLTISVGADFLIFLWIFWILPVHKPDKKALFRGSLIAAIGFEAIKFAMTFIVPNLVKSPSGAAFGSIIALLAFFYLFARLTLFCAAWIATAQYAKKEESLEKLNQL